MRLLHLDTNGDLSLGEYVGSDIPPYAILSHTWGALHEEVTFKDLIEGTGKDKKGYCKITFCGNQAAKDNLEYFWVDTCCIDKSSSAELSEAINSMFNWYKKSRLCYVYLEDVNNDGEDLASSRWFTRGWTLQELLAPAQVVFYSNDWKSLGNKPTLAPAISQITGIDPNALQGSNTLDYIQNTSIAKRMSWASKRKTTREEDIAYCLLGLFNVNMPLLYGEGEKAFLRLQEEIMKSSSDQSLLAWRLPLGFDIGATPQGILANHPRNFAISGNIIPTDEADETSSFSMTNRGLHIRLPVLHGRDRTKCIAVLACIEEGNFRRFFGLPLKSISRHGNVFQRTSPSLIAISQGQAKGSRIKSVYFLKHPPRVEPKPQLLWIANVPAADSGIALVEYKASHGVWDEKNRVIELSQGLGDRWYTLIFGTKDSSFIVVVSPDRESRYLADVKISRQSQPVLLDMTATRQRQSARELRLSSHHTVSASIAWRVIRGREILALEVKVLKRGQRHSIFTFSSLKYIKPDLGLLVTFAVQQWVFLTTRGQCLGLTEILLSCFFYAVGNFLMKQVPFIRIVPPMHYFLVALSLALTSLWFRDRYDWNDRDSTHESAIPLLQTPLSSLMSYYSNAITSFNSAAFFICWYVGTYVIALGWSVIAELIVLQCWPLKSNMALHLLILQAFFLASGGELGLHEGLSITLHLILWILGTLLVNFSVFPSLERFHIFGYAFGSLTTFFFSERF